MRIKRKWEKLDKTAEKSQAKGKEVAVGNLSETTDTCWKIVTISSSRLSFNMEHIDEEEVEEGEEGEILGNNNNNDETQYDDSISLMIDKTIKMRLSQKPFVIMRKILQNSLTTNAKCF